MEFYYIDYNTYAYTDAFEEYDSNVCRCCCQYNHDLWILDVLLLPSESLSIIRAPLVPIQFCDINIPSLCHPYHEFDPPRAKRFSFFLLLDSIHWTQRSSFKARRQGLHGTVNPWYPPNEKCALQRDRASVVSIGRGTGENRGLKETRAATGERDGERARGRAQEEAVRRDDGEGQRDEDGVTPRVVADSRQLKPPRRVTSLSFVSSSRPLFGHVCVSLSLSLSLSFTLSLCTVTRVVAANTRVPCVHLETRTMFLPPPLPSPRTPVCVPSVLSLSSLSLSLSISTPPSFFFTPPPLTHLQYHPFFFLSLLPGHQRPCPSPKHANTTHQLQPLSQMHTADSFFVPPCTHRCVCVSPFRVGVRYVW